jgi:hypothetical protein
LWEEEEAEEEALISCFVMLVDDSHYCSLSLSGLEINLSMATVFSMLL